MKTLSTFPGAKEHAEQCALIRWWRWQAKLGEENLLFAIPNGGRRDARTGAMLKAEGVVAGVPDLFLAVARGGYHGLWLEMKRVGGKASQAQKEMQKLLQAQGYRVEICHGWIAAKVMIEEYLASEKLRKVI